MSVLGPIASLYGTSGGNQWVEVGNATTHMNFGVGAIAPTAGVPYIWSASNSFFIGDDGSPTLFVNGMGGGSVGIGTASPQHLLQVAGTIGAEEVIVSSTGADYVFQPDYRLAPLSEVAEYVRRNHHLPEIPSAEEVKKKGIGVGEMQTKLLAKIEELTLRMIEADERNNRLERQNRELRERVARIEAAESGSRRR